MNIWVHLCMHPPARTFSVSACVCVLHSCDIFGLFCCKLLCFLSKSHSLFAAKGCEVISGNNFLSCSDMTGWWCGYPTKATVWQGKSEALSSAHRMHTSMRCMKHLEEEVSTRALIFKQGLASHHYPLFVVSGGFLKNCFYLFIIIPVQLTSFGTVKKSHVDLCPSFFRKEWMCLHVLEEFLMLSAL